MKSLAIRTFTSATIAILLGITTLLLASLFFFAHTTHAADAKDFDPGHIIDDAVFYNSNAMSAAAIQTFLNAKNPSCDTNGTKPASDWGRSDISHATLASYIRNGTNGYSKDTNFHAPPYVCTKDYKQNIPQMEAASGLCGGISAKSNRTAAQIIKDIADACGINPQVLLVLLQKEQSLITDTWPLNRQFQKATGFDCPDTAPCDPAYAGFFYQVYYAARQFKIYKAYPNNYNYVAERNNNIYWNPDLSRCGSSTVYIQNQATAGLYIYTPYQPNKAALDNLYGTGNSCSSYGNRNFWRLFTDWFGSTRLSYVALDNPRWMQVKDDTRKINWVTGSPISAPLVAGQQIYFPDKIYVNGEWLLRTEWDKESNQLKGIRLSDLVEIPTEPIAPTWMSVRSETEKIDPVRGTPYGSVAEMTAVKVVDKITVNGSVYYRTEWESSRNRPRYLPAASLEAFTFYNMLESRMFHTAKDIDKINLQTGEIVETISAGSYINFSKRITLNDVLYVQATADVGTAYAIALDQLDEYTGKIQYISLIKPRWMKLADDIFKKTLPAIENTGTELPTDLKIYFPEKVNVDGVWYLRTEYDKNKGHAYGIPLDVLTEI